MALFMSFMVFILLFATNSFAETMMLDEIDVRAQKEVLTESLEVREVRETDAKDVGEALQNVSGIWKLRKGGIANDIVLRGFQRDNINVLIDGVRVYGACPNRMDPPSFHLDFAEVDKIEVLEGAFDVRNQGSLAGMVDIRTKSAKKGLGGELDASYGSFNSVSGSAVFSYGTEGFDALAGAAYKYSEPYEDGDGKKFTEIYPSTSPNRYRNDRKDGTAYDIRTGWGKIGFSPVTNHHAEISFTRQEARDVLYPYLLMDADFDDTSRLSLNYKVAEISGLFKSVRLQAYWNRVEHEMDDSKRCSSSSDPSACSGSLPRDYSMKTSPESMTYGGRLEGQMAFWGETTIGLDYYLRNWDATTTMFSKTPTSATYMDQASIPDVDTKNVGLYIEQTNKIGEKFSLTAGVRLDNTNTEANIDRRAVYNLYFQDVKLSQTDTELSGNVQLQYSPMKSFLVFLGLGHSARVPDPVERYFALQKKGDKAKPDWLGNPHLEPVKNNEIDLGVRYTAEKTLLKASVFYSDLQDFIVVREISNGSRFAKTYRGVDAEIYGWQASALISLPSDLYATASVSYSRGENDSGDANLPEIPPLKGNIGIRYDDDRYIGELEGAFSATQDNVDNALGETKTSGWGIMNAKVGYRYKGLKILGGVRNIFDKQYTEYLSYSRDPFASGIKVPEPGRTFYASLNYVF